MKQPLSSDQTVWLGPLLARLARIRADLPVALLDIGLVVVAYTGVIVMRFDGAVPDKYWGVLERSLPLLALLAFAINWAWGLYGQMWRHASVVEARRIALAGITLGACVTLLWRIWTQSLPASVTLLGAGVYTMAAGALRFQSRLFAVNRQRREPGGARVIVLGAGASGAALVREMRRSPRAALHPVAFLDDDPYTQGRTCAGLPVVAALANLPWVAAQFGAQVAVLATPGAPPQVVRRAAELADQAGIPLRVLGTMDARVSNRVGLADLRDVTIDRLLGREQVRIDLGAVAALLADRQVLITGAGGSIGSEISRQVAAFGPSRLLLLDHDETHLHDVVVDLHAPPETAVHQLLADVTDRDRLTQLFAAWRPEVVFHAAAHKHVPMLEANPGEAARTNVIGTSNVVTAAADAGVERLVFISTDKAVEPASVMGASKRLGEQITLAFRPAASRYCAVRFGNVLGSRGSVIPTFLRQIQIGGPVTVTDPRMTRYFMSTREAVQLVLQAAAITEGGEVYTLAMGEPVRIMDLAERMIRLSGHRVGSDIEIRLTGTRPGERLFERLHSRDEKELPTTHPSISQIRPAVPLRAALQAMIDRFVWLTEVSHDEAEVRRLLLGAAAGAVAVGDEAERQPLMWRLDISPLVPAVRTSTEAGEV